MHIRKADHVSLLVADVERSRRFYIDILQMQETPRPKSFDFPGAWLNSTDFQIHLIGEQVPGRTQQVHPGYSKEEMARGRGTHLAFEVDDLDDTVSYLQQRNTPIVGGPQSRGDGVTQLYICDPDGYIIELFERP